MNHEYSQGIASDGAAILKDGQPMTPGEIVEKLRNQQHTINLLMTATYSAKEYIDSKIAYPDTTDEMWIKYKKYNHAINACDYLIPKK